MKSIKSEDDYDLALKRIEDLWGANPNTPEGDELDALVDAVVEFEDEHYPIGPPTPHEGDPHAHD